MTTEPRPVPKDPQQPEAVADAASRLLDRVPPDEYLSGWSRALKRELHKDEGSARFSVGLFQVGEELYALPTKAVVEVQPLAPIRSVPGRSNEVFRGLVSLRGEIHLCASLHALFALEASDDVGDERRFLVVGQEGERWALIVDRVLDFERFDEQDVRGAQVTVSKAAVHFTDGVLQTPRGPAARISTQRLFEGLARSLA